MIARDDIDLVLVITPIDTTTRTRWRRCGPANTSTSRRRWPTTYAEAREMVETADATGSDAASAAPGQMLAPAMQAMKAARIVAARLGDVYWAWGSTGGWHHENRPAAARRRNSASVDPTWYYRAAAVPCATSPSTCCTA